MKYIFLLFLLNLCGSSFAKAPSEIPPTEIQSYRFKPNMVFVNSLDNALEISFYTATQDVIIIIGDSFGNIIYQQSYNTSQSNMVTINTDGWFTGEYIVIVRFSDGTLEKHTFIK